ncbi:MAG TPA: spermidine synthase [Gallionella sp.]|jgi:spermidine synthase|nr:fused MFS/spermidine synthase [Gallionella sp.]OGS66163.1 MAG: spermidine synthase [Gallionellales bacterium GWA2_54_124]HCI52907.1 spermidine synthase [Gallionella sp.]
MTTPIDISEKDGIRYLHFGSSWVQGAMRINRPWNLELEYTREMMASLLLRKESRWPRKILLIGLGAASLTKFLYRYRPDAHLTIVEIEPDVVAAARHFFKLPEDDKRIHMIIGDGAEFVLSTNKKFDLILVDGFNEHAHPGQLNSLPFYQACRSRLSDQGIMAVNLLGLCKGVLGGFAHILTAFNERALLFPSCESGNTIAFATEGELVNINLEDLKTAAIALQEDTGLNLLPTLSRLEKSNICTNSTLII